MTYYTGRGIVHNCSSSVIMGEPVRVVVVGAGSIGREYSLKYLCSEPKILIIGVVDYNISAAESLAQDISYRMAGYPIVGDKYRETVDRTATVAPDATGLPNARLFLL